MAEFTHVLVSRINCDYPIDKFYPPKLYERIAERQFSREWLEKRYEYLSKFTYPSVMSQTTDKFRWIILLHPDTPKDILVKFKGFKSRRISVLTTDLSPREYMPWYIRETVTTPWVMTTTLDADDVISKEYLEAVSGAFRAKKEFINIAGGFKYNMSTDTFHTCMAESNPYITFCEETEGAVGVYCVTHGAAWTVAPVTQVQCDRTKVCWVQVIHGDNLLNRAKVKKKHSKGIPYAQLKNNIVMEF